MSKIEAENIYNVLENYMVKMHNDDWSDFQTVIDCVPSNNWNIFARFDDTRGTICMAAKPKMTKMEQMIITYYGVPEPLQWSPEVAFADIPRLLEMKAFW